jgi:hypothetical protein
MQVANASLTDNRQGKRVCATRGEAQRLLEALKVRHAPIAKMLCSDAGMRLMNLDARIMLTAVDCLIAKGIEAIPIHDSIVIAEHHESEAREALIFGWYSKNPQTTFCRIEKKRPKVSQYGHAHESPGGPSSHAFNENLGHIHEGPGRSSSCPVDWDRGSEGWWSSVIAEARFDVGEWVS